jgi:hypothetical protein
LIYSTKSGREMGVNVGVKIRGEFARIFSDHQNESVHQRNRVLLQSLGEFVQ